MDWSGQTYWPLEHVRQDFDHKAQSPVSQYCGWALETRIRSRIALRNKMLSLKVVSESEKAFH